MKAKPRILVIDNDKNILAAFRISLTGGGYRPLVCSPARGGAEDALRMIHRHRIELVISEIHLNGHNESGLRFLTTLRHKLPHLPIIIVSNQIDDAVEQRLKSLGINGVLTKPIELRVIKRTIKAVLSLQKIRYSKKKVLDQQ
ncbi:MAG: response regulator [Ignavibacteriae bacterium]|nr:response regulator [Ignavibacteriota bacterium]